MDTLNFLQRVLPSEGFFVTTVINTDGNKQGFFSTVEELAKAVVGLDQRGNNTYFAISSFLEKGSRKQENVKLTKVLVLDVDCGEGKPFPSWKEGLKALGKFITDVGLPKPMIVHSGNGLHVYWVLDRELPPDEWKPLAEALKAATIAKGFDVDAGLTANSALVLRPIGTHNPKNGNEVNKSTKRCILSFWLDAMTSGIGHWCKVITDRSCLSTRRTLSSLDLRMGFPFTQP